jgi:A/G-specific adenine glycosylase
MMLQQTQVKTVIPYYKRFLESLPDWKSLARAKPEKVLKLWEGLGYYRRARNLQAAAQMVIRDFEGRLPDSLPEILRLPGVGPYSAGALLSIAHGKAFPLVDGNVIRVYSRLFLLRGNLKTGPGHEMVWETAQKTLSAKNPGDFNQALMELGATVCLPEHPLCLICPLSSRCLAARKGCQDLLPEMPKAKKPVALSMAAVYVKKEGKILVRKRSDGEKWLKNMWELPSAEGSDFQAALDELGKILTLKIGKPELKEIRHQITHHKITLRLYQAAGGGQETLPPGFKWVTPAELARLPFASAQNRLRKWVLKS